MGDRISISFKNGDEESVVLFSHWDGVSLVRKAKAYVKDLKKTLAEDERTGGLLGGGPTGRMEPNTIMVDFVRYLTRNLPIVDGNYYFGRDKHEGDNSDNGHKIIILDK